MQVLYMGTTPLVVVYPTVCATFAPPAIFALFLVRSAIADDLVTVTRLTVTASDHLREVVPP
jgi:hypothetical protein